MSQLLNHYSDDVFFVSSTPSAEKGELDLLSKDILKDFFLNIGVSFMSINRLHPDKMQKKRIEDLDQTVAEKIDQTRESVRREGNAIIPVGRCGRVKEFTDTATFICSDRASYITGSLIRCDGSVIKSVNGGRS